MDPTTLTGFNLAEFIRQTATHTPNHAEWKQIIMYSAAIGYPKEKLIQLGNAAWNPRDLQETGRVYDAHCENSVTRGSMIRYLRLYGKDIDYNRIWTKNTVRYYNEYNEFLKRNTAFTYFEVERYLLDTVQYITSCKKFTWLYHTTIRDKYGHSIKNVVRSITGDPPFFKSDDFMIKISPGFDEIKEALERFCEKSKNSKQIKPAQSLLNTIDDIPLTEAITRGDSICGFTMPVPKSVKASKIVNNAQLHGMFKRYIKVEFAPYAGTTDHTDPEILNTFSGFPMESYVPTKRVDIKSTTIWRYLYDVFGHQQKGMERLNHLLDLLAWKITHPNRRSGRIVCVVSKRQGTGKSSLFHLIQCATGKQLCSFHDSLDTLLGRFNFPNHSKLLHWIDDITSQSKTITRKMFPKATCAFQKYEAKCQGVIELQEYSEFWLTANDIAPLHVSPEDRRIMIIEASDCHEQDTEFFNKLYEEFDDMDIGHALYTFLKNRDTSKFHPSQNPPSLAKAKSLECCMVKSHMFVKDFFQDYEWLLQYKTANTPNSQWTSLYQVTQNATGVVQIRIENKRFYRLYTGYVKAFHPSSRARNADTFYREMEQLGIVKHTKRRKINGKNKTGVDIYFKSLKAIMNKLYSATVVGEWISEVEPETFIKTLADYQTAVCW